MVGFPYPTDGAKKISYSLVDSGGKRMMLISDSRSKLLSAFCL